MSLLNDASLVFIPSGYKEDKVYSIIPSNGAGDLDFVRGCDATRINPQSLVEGVSWNLVENSNTFNTTWQYSSSSIIINNAIAPNGTQTATKATCASGASISPNIYYSGTINCINNQVYTYSYYAKKGSTNYAKIRFSGTAFASSTNSPFFNLDAGTVVSGTGTIESVGNGWYRISATATAEANATGVITVDIPNASGSWPSATFAGTEYIYIWGAQLNIGSTAKPYFPTTDRLNVPRLTYSPTLIERQSTNICTYSEDLTNADWIKSYCSITANDTISPDGAQTADKLTATATGSIYAYNANTSLSSNRTNSIYLKKGNWNEVTFLGNSYNNGTFATFDLNAGTILSSANCTPAIESVGNGWYRCSMTLSTNYFHLITLNGHTNNSIPNGSYIYIWGGQTETGALSSYIPTTSTAVTRTATYNSGCPSLLLEKQSTNLALYSEQLDDAAWSKIGTTISANATTSPDGTQNADNATPTGTGFHSIQQTITTTGTISYKIYAKYNGYNIWLQIGAASGSTAFFNLQNGSTSNSATFPATYGTGFTQVSKSITSLGNGWYECNLVATGASTAITIGIAPDENTAMYTANGSSVYLWGAQLEASSYPTSYIKTTSATATRLADSCSKTGISSLIGQTEGTVFLDFQLQTVGEDYVIGQIYNSSSSADSIYFYIDSSNYLRAYVDNSGTQVNIITPSALSVGNYKVAIAYKQNDFVFYVNGTQIGTDTSGTVPTCNSLKLIDYANGSGYMENSAVKQYLLFKRRLTNTELEKLTTL